MPAVSKLVKEKWREMLSDVANTETSQSSGLSTLNSTISMCERCIVVVKIVHRISKISDIMFSVTGTHAACQTVSRKIEVQSLPEIEPNAVPNASDHVVVNESRRYRAHHSQGEKTQH